LFFASLPPTLALSWLLLRFVEGPVDRFRESLKTQES
jgi:peptidoglycan/LPS O-acetylase OafA/YrhL